MGCFVGNAVTPGNSFASLRKVVQIGEQSVGEPTSFICHGLQKRERNKDRCFRNTKFNAGAASRLQLRKQPRIFFGAKPFVELATQLWNQQNLPISQLSPAYARLLL